MKRNESFRLISKLMVLIMLFSMVMIAGPKTTLAVGNTYYVKNGGNNSADGLSDGTAWATLDRVNRGPNDDGGSYAAGDKILLKSGSQFIGQCLAPQGSGDLNNPITIDKYGTGAMPVIEAQGYTQGGSAWQYLTPGSLDPNISYTLSAYGQFVDPDDPDAYAEIWVAYTDEFGNPQDALASKITFASGGVVAGTQSSTFEITGTSVVTDPFVVVVTQDSHTTFVVDSLHLRRTDQPDTIVNFTGKANGNLNGTYPTNGISWGTGRWKIVGAPGNPKVTVRSTATQVTKSFTLPSGKILKSLKVNGPVGSTVIINGGAAEATIYQEYLGQPFEIRTYSESVIGQIDVAITVPSGYTADQVTIDDIVYGEELIAYGDIGAVSGYNTMFAMNFFCDPANRGYIVPYTTESYSKVIGKSAAISLHNQQYWNIKGIKITNNKGNKDFRYGITVDAADATNVSPDPNGIYVLNGIHIDGVEIKDIDDVGKVPGEEWWFASTVELAASGSAGIRFMVYGSQAQTQFKDISVRRCDISNTGSTGIATSTSWSGDRIVPEDIYIPTEGLVIENNIINNVGSGAYLVQCRFPIVQFNAMSDFNRGHGAGVGICVHGCDGGVMQYNEMFGGHAGADGHPFDISQQTNDIYVQYNYSHNNEAGFLELDSASGYFANNCVARYNISQDDGFGDWINTPDGGLKSIMFVGGGNVQGMKIYNNTIYATQAANPNYEISLVDFQVAPSGHTEDIEIFNNIFYGTTSGKVGYSSLGNYDSVQQMEYYDAGLIDANSQYNFHHNIFYNIDEPVHSPTFNPGITCNNNLLNTDPNLFGIGTGRTYIPYIDPADPNRVIQDFNLHDGSMSGYSPATSAPCENAGAPITRNSFDLSHFPLDNPGSALTDYAQAIVDMITPDIGARIYTP